MNKLFPNENEKNKEIEETTEAESYDNYENEAMENAEGSLLEEISFSKDSLFSGADQTARSTSCSEKETDLEGSLKEKEEKNRLLIEKWFSVTGKKPISIPIVRRHFDETYDKITFFGDRKPEDIERKRAEKMFLEAKRVKDLGLTYGKIRQEIRFPPLSLGLSCVKFAPNANFLAFSDRSGIVQIRECPSGEVTINLNPIERNERTAVRSLKYFPEDSKKLFLGGQAGVIQVFDTQSGELLGVSNNLGVINVLDISPDSSVLATGGRNGTLCLLDPRTLQIVWKTCWPDVDETTRLEIDDAVHRLRIYALKFHPTEHHLFASGGCDNLVKIWDVRMGKAIKSIRGPAIFGEALDLLDNRIITASWRVENSLSLWDFPSGRLIKNISIQNKATKYEGEFLYCTQFFKDNPAYDSIGSNTIAVGGSGFKEVLVINIETEKVLTYFPSFKAVVNLDIAGNLIVYGGKESVFRIGEIENKRRTRQFAR